MAILEKPVPSFGGFFVALLAFAGCGSSGPSSVGQDSAVAGTPTLETGIDLPAFVAAVTPQAAQLVTLVIQPGAAADTIRLGRPWGKFVVHKGPRLAFLGSWSVLVASGDDYVAIGGVVRDGDSYKMISIGSTQFVPIMLEHEQIPEVSAALDRGRAGLLRRISDGGDMFIAYETGTVADAGQAEIRVQPLGLRVIDAGVLGVAEMGLDELEALLPAE